MVNIILAFHTNFVQIVSLLCDNGLTISKGGDGNLLLRRLWKHSPVAMLSPML